MRWRADVLQSGLRLASIGIVAAIRATTLMRSWLFGVGALDAVTYLVVAAFVFVVTGVACFVPALRAARVDPVVAFRVE